MALVAQTELHAHESELESSIPTPPNPRRVSAIPTPPQSFLVNGNRKIPNKISTLSSLTHRLFHANKRERPAEPNKLPETHFSSLASSVTFKRSTPSPVDTPGLTNLSVSLAKSSNSASAEVPSLLEGLRICTHQKGKLYINPTAPIPVEMKNKWEQELNPRLIEELRRLNLDYGCADLFIAGRKEHQLAPTIAVLCTSLESKRNIAKRLKSSKLSAEFASLDIRLEILVDCNFGLKGSLDFLFSDPEFPVEVLISETARHLKCVLIRSKESSNQNAVCTTLGGLVAINGKLYGLTVGHTFSRGFKDMMLTNGFGRGLDRNEKRAPQAISDFESDDESSVWSEDEMSLDTGDGGNEELETSENQRQREINSSDSSHGRMLQRSPSRDLRANQNGDNFENEIKSKHELMPRPSSAYSVTTHTSTTFARELYIDQTGKQSPESRSPPLSKTSLTEPIVSAFKRPLSWARAHSSPLSLRPSLETAAAELARIPDDEGDDIEAALLKLEGKTKTSGQMETSPAAPQDRQIEKQRAPVEQGVGEPKNSNKKAQPTAQASIIYSDGHYPQSLENYGKDATPTDGWSSRQTYSKAYTFFPLLEQGLSSHQDSYHHLGSLNALGWAYDRYLPWHKMSSWIYACLYQFQTSSSNSDWALIDLDTNIIHRLGLADRVSLKTLPVERTKTVELDSKTAPHASIINADGPNIDGFGSRVLDTDELGTIEVYIHGGKSGLQAGILNQCPSRAILMQSMFTLRQITLQRVLG